MARRKFQHRPLLFSLLTFFLITLEPDLYGIDTPGFFESIVEILARYKDFSLPTFLLLPGLWLLYRYVSEKVGGSLLRPSVLIPAILFGVSMPLGFAFEEVGDLSPLFTSGPIHFLMFLLNATGWSILAVHCVALLYHLLEKAPQKNGPEAETTFSGPFRWYRRLLFRNPFWTVFLTLTILYIPHAVLSYPAIFMGDTWQVIVQAYSELKQPGYLFITPETVLIPGIYINQAHSVAITLILHTFLVFGDALTGSLNTGMALFCGLQALFVIASFAYSASLLIQRGSFSPRFAWVILLFGFASPIVHTSVFLLTKDVPYAAAVLFLFANLFRVLTGDRSPRVWIGLALSSLGVFFFRNEAPYVLLLFFLLAAFICKETRKSFFIAAGSVALTWLLVIRLLFPALGFTPGSVRDPLSIPFQQTARYLRDCPDDVTEEEHAAIAAILDYDNLADEYDPDLADPVKHTYRESSTTQDLMNYFSAWASMGLRHPDVYLQAFMNNNYQRFYPGKTRLYLYDYGWSNTNYNYTNQKIEPLNRSFSQIRELGVTRSQHDHLMSLAENVPILDVLSTPAFYTWVVILAFCYAIRRKDRHMIAWAVLPSILLLFNMFTPCNGYFARYTLPVIFASPFFFSFLIGFARRGGSR